MSLGPISRSPDLRRLREEGFEIVIRDGFLVVDHIPYVNHEAVVKYGKLISSLTMAGDATARPDTHVADFAGDTPCDAYGRELTRIMAGSARREIAPSLFVDHMFSSKPPAGYADYYEKMSTYAQILGAPALAIDPAATARTFAAPVEDGSSSPFKYEETASSRAGIGVATDKLRMSRIAIVGLGGTGAYILDLVAKTPVDEIHLFDADRYLTHNAFRSPGAATLEELRSTPNKAIYLMERYAPMRNGIHAHPVFIDETNVDALAEMEFVFLALDDGIAKRTIVDRLEEWGTPFVDVGIGVYEVEGSLGGQVRVTASAEGQRDHVHEKNRIPFGPGDPENLYRQNIQIADLNCLNAALAVIKWKKLCGYYLDFEREGFSVYEIDGNNLLNEDGV
jgi:hypothetical protein